MDAFEEVMLKNKGKLDEVLMWFKGTELELKPPAPDWKDRVRLMEWTRSKRVLMAGFVKDDGLSQHHETTFSSLMAVRLHEILWDLHEPTLRRSMENAILHPLHVWIRRQFQDVLRSPVMKDLFQEDFFWSLEYFIGFTLAESRDADSLKHLMSFWSTGNFPAGLNRDGDLILLSS